MKHDNGRHDMLTGTINLTIEHQYYPKCITQIFEYLNSLDLSKLALGRHELPLFPSDKAWFVILEYQKQPQSELLPEVHKYHSDLQIVLSGSEKMAWTIDNGNHTPAEAYNNTRDLQFYRPETIALNYLKALPGHFYLFTPNTIHVTNIEDGRGDPVRKLVVKIHNDLLAPC
ncbi:YhcH/YjgK/YiaL family protein [Vibrio sp. RC27]